MKRITRFFPLLALFFLVSCAKQELTVQTAPTMHFGTATAPTKVCGTPTVVDLMAGQHYVAGSVSVSNDANYAYVTYTTTGDWRITGLQLYVGDCANIPVNKSGNPIPGQFPYKASFTAPYQTTYTFAVPLASLPACFCVAAHANVVRVDAAGNILQSETGWGKGTPFNTSGGNWAMKFEYCKQTCVETPKCYQEETAWAAGNRFTAVGNWATYTTYAPNTTVNLYAGQTNLAGTASFSAIDANGNVTITISLTSPWSLQSVSEPVKIQGYNTAPSGNPAPGTFTTYKGTSTTLVVPAYAIYGIHLDVRKEVACN